ncbi:MAG: hypothetical protein IJV94_01045 [Bacilli bacterium]|nr:hypothetical protein [Bacilli bacterium]
MKKSVKKIIPFVMFATLLSSCSNELTLKDGEDKTIVKENASYELDLTTYQDVFDDLFTASGAETASKELVYRIAKQVVDNIDSEDAKTQKLEAGLLGKDGSYYVAGYTFNKKRLAEKVKEKLNSYYTAAYKSNGLFDERLLANSLRLSGYNIELPENYYRETKDSLLKYGNLADKLKGDYSELIEEKLLKDIYIELLKEEYIITQHPEYLKSTQTSSETAYSAYSKVKYVEYFSYTPAKSSDANKINEQLEKTLNSVLETKNKMSGDAKLVTKNEFKLLVTGQFEPVVRKYELENLDKEFAKIDYKHPTDDYLNIYDQKEKEKLSKAEVSEAETLINSYSNNGSYSIYDGYDLKQLSINSKKYYNDAVVSTKSSTIINTSIDGKLKLANDKLADALTENGFLDYYNNDNPLFKLDGTYYIVRVETIYNHKYVKATKESLSSSDEALLDAVELLATHSSYTSNTIKFYLDQFYEAEKLTLHNEEVYEYLKATYNFNIED